MNYSELPLEQLVAAARGFCAGLSLSHPKISDEITVLVDAFEAHLSVDPVSLETSAKFKQYKHAYENGGIIPAIKLFREKERVGVKEAREQIDSLASKHRWKLPPSRYTAITDWYNTNWYKE